MTTISTPQQAYEDLLETGELRSDVQQEAAIARLQTLYGELEDYGQQMGKTGWLARLSLVGGRKKTPKGIYMWGGVGRGKSMLMELFHNNSSVKERKHIHFHSFMQEVHRRVHSYRQAQAAGKVSSKADPLTSLARVITDQAWLLCFDEFHVTDIADAMLLGRLFEVLFEEGVVVVATSNRPPKDLYKGGLQRELFLPFIDLIEQHMDVIELNSPTDYRLEQMREMDVYLSSSDKDNHDKLHKDFKRLTTGATSHHMTLQVQGRDIEFKETAEGVAMASFSDLCEKPLGPGDYLAIAARFHTMILADIPIMGPESRNEAKRFVTLIDTLYEARVNLICSAAAKPDDLYESGDGSFEFERTASRLMEMQSPDYIAQAHITA